MTTERQPKAVLYPSRSRGKDGKRINGWRFRLKGLNGEKIAASEHYTTKAKALQTLARYFAGFKVVEEVVTSNIKG